MFVQDFCLCEKEKKKLWFLSQAWITIVQRCLSTASVFSSTCSSRCRAITTSRPSPQSCCKHVRSMAPRPWLASQGLSWTSYPQVKIFTWRQQIFFPLSNLNRGLYCLGRCVPYLRRHVWPLSQKQYWAQRTSKVTIKTFHHAILNLLLKLKPSASTYAGWSGYKPS